MVSIEISDGVLAKLTERHSVTRKEVEECFLNHHAKFFRDPREEHGTDPPTHWFIGDTNHCRQLKICFILREKKFQIKTAYAPNKDEIDLWHRLLKR